MCFGAVDGLDEGRVPQELRDDVAQFVLVARELQFEVDELLHLSGDVVVGRHVLERQRDEPRVLRAAVMVDLRRTAQSSRPIFAGGM